MLEASSLLLKFKIVFVSVDKNPAKAAEWMKTNLKETKFQSSVYQDPEFAAAEGFSVDSFPIECAVIWKVLVT